MNELAMNVEKMKLGNADAKRDCANLYNEADALSGHMEMLHGQNYTMNRELGDFVEVDGRIKQTLDKRQRMNHLRVKNETAV